MADHTSPQKPQIAPLAAGLRSETFPVAMNPDGKTVNAKIAAFIRTAEQGFYEPWLSDEQINHIGQVLIKDEQTLTAVYVDQDAAAQEPWGAALGEVGFEPATRWAPSWTMTRRSTPGDRPARCLPG